MNASALLRAVSAITVVAAAPSAGQQSAPALPAVAQEVDALTASPENFRLLLENDRVRVLEYTLLPGKRDRRHTHPRRVAHILSGGTLRVHFSDGRHLDFEEKTGTSEWSDPSPLHDPENIGTTPIRILLVDVKNGPAQ